MPDFTLVGKMNVWSANLRSDPRLAKDCLMNKMVKCQLYLSRYSPHRANMWGQNPKRFSNSSNSAHAQVKRHNSLWSCSKVSLAPQRHSSVAAKVTSLLVWVQEIRFGKQNGAASRQRSALQPRRRAVCAPVSLLILRPAAALGSLSKYWADVKAFS